MEDEHGPFSEPATPVGVGGFVGMSDNIFSFRDCISGGETDFGYQTDLSLRFLQQ